MARKPKTHFTCLICQKIRPRKVMQKSLKGRTLQYCNYCNKLQRCRLCGVVQSIKKFRSRGTNAPVLEDGTKSVIRVCYKCEHKQKTPAAKERARQARQKPTFQSFIAANYSSYRITNKTLNISSLVSRDELVALWNKQKGKCFYTNQNISLQRGPREFDGISLDKMNPQKGYVSGNVVWTTKRTNIMKGNATVPEFLNTMKQILEIHT